MDPRTRPADRMAPALGTEAQDADFASGAPGLRADREEREGFFSRMVRRRPRRDQEDDAGSGGGLFRRKGRDRRPRNLAFR